MFFIFGNEIKKEKFKTEYIKYLIKANYLKDRMRNTLTKIYCFTFQENALMIYIIHIHI